MASVTDSPLGIKLLYHDLYHIELPVRKILIAPKKILQEADML